MKRLASIVVDFDRCREELTAFKALLDRHESGILKERERVLPFFRKHRNLAALIGHLYSDCVRIDRIAYEDEILRTLVHSHFCVLPVRHRQPERRSGHFLSSRARIRDRHEWRRHARQYGRADDQPAGRRIQCVQVLHVECHEQREWDGTWMGSREFESSAVTNVAVRVFGDTIVSFASGTVLFTVSATVFDANSGKVTTEPVSQTNLMPGITPVTWNVASIIMGIQKSTAPFDDLLTLQSSVLWMDFNAKDILTVSLQYAVAMYAVPEPSSWLLLSPTLLGLLGLTRRRRKPSSSGGGS